ncbi:MAG: hypothetical protein CM15mP102_13520 [Flavobacteriales bacterium]|nr:MAG: hypothetical protein CM15mP102_13520 [Flavobacteriales bacterium]
MTLSKIKKIEDTEDDSLSIIKYGKSQFVMILNTQLILKI